MDIANPATWGNWEADLKNAGLSQIECNRVTALVLEAKSLDDESWKGPRGFSCWSGAGPQILWPSGPTGEYAVWGACERLGILPPGVKPAWDDCGVEAQALIVAFHQTRSYDEAERDAQLAGARMPIG